MKLEVVATTPAVGTYGRPLTFKVNAALDPSRPFTAPSGAPTGVITVHVGGRTCEATLTEFSSGSSSGNCTMAPLDSGDAVLTNLVYSGDAKFAASTSSTSIKVAKASTSVAMSSAANPSARDDLVIFSGSVLPNPVGEGEPTGLITFQGSSGVLCTAVIASAGTGSCSARLTVEGAQTLSASYGGDKNFLASASPAYVHSVRPKAEVTGLIKLFGTYRGSDDNGTLALVIDPATLRITGIATSVDNTQIEISGAVSDDGTAVFSDDATGDGSFEGRTLRIEGLNVVGGNWRSPTGSGTFLASDIASGCVPVIRSVEGRPVMPVNQVAGGVVLYLRASCIATPLSVRTTGVITERYMATDSNGERRLTTRTRNFESARTTSPLDMTGSVMDEQIAFEIFVITKEEFDSLQTTIVKVEMNVEVFRPLRPGESVGDGRTVLSGTYVAN